MDRVARLSPQDRRDLFSESASALGVGPAVIEKDFWVCLVLKTLFTDPTFQGSPWARYDLGKTGSFRILPTDESSIKRLASDYRDMQVMFFGNPPEFSAILAVLGQLETEINGRVVPLKHHAAPKPR